jgi:putative transposase
MLINQIFKKHDGNYGSSKITRELVKQDVHIGQKRVAHIMHEHGLRAIKAVMYRTKKGLTAFAIASPYLIFEKTITGVNQAWSGDVTYIRMPDDT